MPQRLRGAHGHLSFVRKEHLLLASHPYFKDMREELTWTSRMHSHRPD